MRQTNGLKGCRSNEVANNSGIDYRMLWQPAAAGTACHQPRSCWPQLCGTTCGRSEFWRRTQM